MGFLISLRLGSVRRLRPSLSRHNVELSVVMDAVAKGEEVGALAEVFAERLFGRHVLLAAKAPEIGWRSQVH